MKYMLYQPDYTIRVGESDLHFLFNSFAFKKFTSRKGIELEDFLRKVQKTLTSEQPKEGATPEEIRHHEEIVQSLKDVKPFSTDDVPELLLATHESYCLYNKIPFTATEMDAMDWVDSLGGFVMGIGAFSKIFILLAAKLYNIDPAVLDGKVEEEEKKRELPKVRPSVKKAS